MLQSMGSQRIRHDFVTEQQQQNIVKNKLPGAGILHIECILHIE